MTRESQPPGGGRRPLRAGPAAAALGLLLAAGCDSNFLPESYLHDLRVLALLADPLEAGPAEAVAVRAEVFVPQGDALLRGDWSLCPVSAGAASGFACAVPACEVPLAEGPGGAVRATPHTEALRCLADLAQAAGGVAGTWGTSSGELPEQVEALFRYRVATRAGQQREAVLRLPVWTVAAPTARNRPPVIAAVRVAGRDASPGGVVATVGEGEEVALEVIVDPASLDSYQDTAGRQRTEEPLVSFYATAGRFAYDRELGLQVQGSWAADALEPDQRQAQIWAVARDLRGGQAVAGPFLVSLSR